jgi:hypothetical protein
MIRTWLHEKETRNPDAVEHIFCRKMEQCVFEKSPAFQQALLICNDPAWYTAPLTEFQNWLLGELQDRTDLYLTIKIDNRLLLFIILVSPTINEAWMLLVYCQYHTTQKKSYYLLFDKGMALFAGGIPSAADFKKLWAAQKVNAEKKSNNLLDYQIAMRSIL